MMSKALQDRFRQIDRELQQIEEYLDAMAQEVQEVTAAYHQTDSAWVWGPTGALKGQIETLRKALAQELGVASFYTLESRPDERLHSAMAGQVHH